MPDESPSAAQSEQEMINKFIDLGKSEPQQPAKPATAPEQPKPVQTPEVQQKPVTEAARPKDDALEPPEGMSVAAKDSWKKFRETTQARIDKSNAELEATRKELEVERKREVKPSVDLTEFETVKKRAQELESKVERYDLENSDKFKNYFDGGIQKHVKIAKSVAGERAGEVEKLLMTPRSAERDEKLREIVDELGLDGGVILESLSGINKLKLERSEQLSNHRDNLVALRAHEAAQAKQADEISQATQKARVESVFSKIATMPEFNADPTDTEHTTFSTNAKEIIRRALNGELADEDVLKLPVAAMKAQYLEGIRLPKMQAEIEALKARILEYEGANPRAAGSKYRAPQDSTLASNDPWGSEAAKKIFFEGT